MPVGAAGAAGAAGEKKTRTAITPCGHRAVK